MIIGKRIFIRNTDTVFFFIFFFKMPLFSFTLRQAENFNHINIEFISKLHIFK